MKNHLWRLTVVILGLALFFALVPALMWASPKPSAKSVAGVSDPASSPADTAKLSFRRIFKSSSPEFIEIVVPEDGRPATYEIRQLDEDPGATPFELSAGLRARMFDLAEKLNHFQGQDLDVHRKIANLGEKTFTLGKG